MNEEVQQQIEQIIGYKFSDRNLLIKALTHSSAAVNRLSSNERLEFLGDSILALVICQTLFERFPGYLEGDLTKIKSMLVSRITCAQIAIELGLQKFLKVGKGLASDRALSGSLAAGLLEDHRDRIAIPVDVAVAENGERAEIEVAGLPVDGLIVDIGSQTIAAYEEEIARAGTVFVNGPAGAFERPGADLGTRRMWAAVAAAPGTTLIGGGDTGSDCVGNARRQGAMERQAGQGEEN